MVVKFLVYAKLRNKRYYQEITPQKVNKATLKLQSRPLNIVVINI